MAREKRHFDIDIVDLAEHHVAETARIHAACFPDKLETLLGLSCIEDCLRRRYIQPHGDCYCRVAVSRDNGRVAAYCHAERFKGGSGLANAFLRPDIAKAHLWRSGWMRPKVWLWLLRRVWARLFSRPGNEGDTLSVRDDWEVAKMLGIHPDYRGGNVGIDLMLDNEAEARKRGSKRICGLVEQNNIKAEKLYKSIGWVRTTENSTHWKVFAMHRELE